MDNTEPVEHLDTDVDEIDLRELILVLWRYRKLILGIFLASVLLGTILSFAFPPVYEVRTKIMLGRFVSSQKGVQTLITPETAEEILTSKDFQYEALQGASKLEQNLNVTPVPKTNVLQLVLETSDPKQGKEFINKITDLFNQQVNEQIDEQRVQIQSEMKRVKTELAELDNNIKSIKDMLDALSEADSSVGVEAQQARLLDTQTHLSMQRETLQTKKLQYEQQLNSTEGVKIIEKPAASSAPVRPNKKLNIAVAMVLGIVIGVFIALIADYFKKYPLNLRGNG